MRLVGAPYELDRALRLEIEHDRVAASWADDQLDGRITSPHTRPPAPATLDAFLLERYWAYSATAQGGLVAVRVDHAAWPVRALELASSSRGAAELAHFSTGVDPVVRDIRWSPAGRKRPARVG